MERSSPLLDRRGPLCASDAGPLAHPGITACMLCFPVGPLASTSRGHAPPLMLLWVGVPAETTSAVFDGDVSDLRYAFCRPRRGGAGGKPWTELSVSPCTEFLLHELGWRSARRLAAWLRLVLRLSLAIKTSHNVVKVETEGPRWLWKRELRIHERTQVEQRPPPIKISTSTKEGRSFSGTTFPASAIRTLQGADATREQRHTCS